MKRIIVSSVIVILVAVGWREVGASEPMPTPQGELRIVDLHRLNWTSVVLNIFEHLLDEDTNGVLVPRLATKWRWIDDRTVEFSLRRGVKFHNGEVFDADIVKLNWEENISLKQPFVPGAFMNFKPGSRLEIIDPYTVRFVFPEPDGGALNKIAALHMGNRQFQRELGGWGEKGW